MKSGQEEESSLLRGSVDPLLITDRILTSGFNNTNDPTPKCVIVKEHEDNDDNVFKMDVP